MFVYILSLHSHYSRSGALKKVPNMKSVRMHEGKGHRVKLSKVTDYFKKGIHSCKRAL